MFLKVNSGPSHMTCLPRRDSSEALVKETCLFHSRDGSFLLITVQQSGSNNYSDNPHSLSNRNDVLVDPWILEARHVYFL